MILTDKIRRILVPLDSSATAMESLIQANRLATKLGCSMDLLHVNTLQMEANMPVEAITLSNMQKITREAIQERVRETMGIDMEVRFELGVPADRIEELSKEYDLIIMGSTGEHGLMDRWLGSISSAVAQRAHCPVLLIPKGSPELDFENVLYAYSSNSHYGGIAAQLRRISPEGTLKHVHFVEMMLPLESPPSRLDAELAESLLADNVGDLQLTTSVIEGSIITNVLNRYTEKHGINLIVMSTKHRTPIQHFFHKSQTKKMVMEIKHPLLVLHTDD